MAGIEAGLAKQSRLANIPRIANYALATALSALALTGVVKTSVADADTIGGPPVPGEVTSPLSQDPLTNECETAAIYSYTGGYLNYINRNHTTNRYVREVVRAKALPTDCDGVVSRVFSAEEMIGSGTRFHPNTALGVVDQSNDAFNKSIVQSTARPYVCGRSVMQIVHVEAIPADGEQPVVNNFVSPPARAC